LSKQAYEIFTLIVHKNVVKKFLHKYIVISTSASNAIRLIKLRENEEVLEAKTMEHELVME
jgi:hypothetical protein